MGRATRRRPRPTGPNAGVFQGGRALAAPGPSWVIGLHSLASLFCVLILGATWPKGKPRPLRATHPERSTGRCRSTARSAASTFIFSQMLRSSTAEELNKAEMQHSSSSNLCIFAVAVIAGLLVFGELISCLYTHVTLPLPLCSSLSLSLSLCAKYGLQMYVVHRCCIHGKCCRGSTC